MFQKVLKINNLIPSTSIKKCLKFYTSGVNLIPGTGYDVMFLVYFTTLGLGPCILII
jgi:hypothetical protein